MKRVALLVLLAQGASAGEPGKSKLPAVVELYNKVSSHKVARGTGEMPWTVNCSAGRDVGELCPARVDEKNRFLSWNESQSGGCFQEEAALFVTSDKRQLLLVADTCADGQNEDATPAGWDATGEAANALPSDFFPRVRIVTLLKDGCPDADRSKLLGYERSLKVRYVLPRTGTTSRATLDLKALKQSLEEARPEGMEDVEPGKVEQALGTLVDRCLYETIEIPFEAHTGTFSLGKRLAAKK